MFFSDIWVSFNLPWLYLENADNAVSFIICWCVLPKDSLGKNDLLIKTVLLFCGSSLYDFA